MDILKRIKKDLINYKVDINDSNLYSPYFFNIVDIETIFGYGKNLILLNPNYNVLDPNYDIDVELLDSNKSPIYYTISSKALTDKSRIITVYIDKEVPNGVSALTLIGKTKDNKYIKYNHSILVSKKDITNSDIYFISQKPTIQYSELKKRKYELTYNSDREVSIYGNANLDRKLNKTILTDANASFNKKMIGNSLNIKVYDINLDNNINFKYNTEYQYKIDDVLDSSHIVLSSNVKLKNESLYLKYEPDSLYNVEYTSSYVQYGTESNIPNIKSYLYIDLYNLKNDSGYIDSIGVFSKSNNSKHETYKLINKSDIKSKDLLIDTSNINIEYRIGKILNQSHIDTYISSTDNNVNLTFNSNDLDESFETEYSSIITSSYDILVGSNNSTLIHKNHKYTIELSYFYKPDSNFESNSKMEVIIGGDPISKSGENLLVGTVINVTDNNRGKIKYNFTTEVDANIYPIFRVHGGKWYISNISISSYNSYGFNPEHTYCYMEIPNDIRNDDLEFNLEFYNQNNKKSKYFYQINRMLVDGSNLYVNGRDNIINGTLYIGDDVNKGIQLEQHNSASIIRTYNFDPDIKSGFMIYSGSNPITESSHVFGDMGIYMQTNDGRFFDFKEGSLDIDATSLKVNGVTVGAGGGVNDTWITFGFFSDGNSIVEGTNGTESILNFTGSNGVSASILNSTMSFHLEPIYDYTGTFTTELTGDVTLPIKLKQSGSISGFVKNANLVVNNGKYHVVGLSIDGSHRTSTQYGERYGIGLSLTSNTGSQEILLQGYVFIDDQTFIPGSQLFISGSGRLGSIYDIEYSSGHWVQSMGYALTSNIVYFNPGYGYLTGSVFLP